MNNVPGKSPSVRRVAVIAGAFTVLASAVTPASAAPQRAKPAATKKQGSRVPVACGGRTGPASLEWAISAPLRP